MHGVTMQTTSPRQACPNSLVLRRQIRSSYGTLPGHRNISGNPIITPLPFATPQFKSPRAVQAPLRTGTSISTMTETASGAGPESFRAILCLGDSLTQGWSGIGTSAPRPYTDRLTQRLRDRGATTVIKNDGYSGEYTMSMLNRLKTSLMTPQVGTSPRYDLVLIQGGTNDLGQWIPADIVSNLKAMHDVAYRTGAHVGLMTIPEARISSLRSVEEERDRLEVNRKLREFVKSSPHRTILIDLDAALPQDAAHAQIWAADGLHLSPKGYEAMGDLISEAQWSR